MSVEIKEPETETFEKPRELNPKQVCYYSHHYKQIVDEQGKKRANVLNHKAILFIQHDCIEYDEWQRIFICHPLKGYNKRKYEIKKEQKHKGFTCNCQACITKIKKGEYDPKIDDFAPCSHILSLYYYFRRKFWKNEKKQKII